MTTRARSATARNDAGSVTSALSSVSSLSFGSISASLIRTASSFSRLRLGRTEQDEIEIGIPCHGAIIAGQSVSRRRCDRHRSADHTE
jgi:hypothetical protein